MRRFAALLVLVLTGLALVGSPAHAADGERITSYAIAYDVGPDGDVRVEERISYDFGASARHGVERFVQTRERYDDDNRRIYDIRDASASSSTGAPSQVSVEEVEEPAGFTRIRIGDPNVTVTGPHDYTLTYVIEGALNAFPNRAELFWDAAGPDWRVPIDELTVTVTAPGEITRVRCFAGPPGSKAACTDSGRAGGTATFTQSTLQPGEVLTVVAAFPVIGVTVPDPVLEPSSAFARNFRATPATVGASAGVVVLGVLPFGLVLLRRRDRQYSETVPGLAPAPGVTASTEAVPIGGSGEVAVQFTPPADVSPAEAGVLLRRKPHVDQTTATLIDLAVRGYLGIEESGDIWTLTVRRGPDPALRPHEHALLGSLFATAPSIRLPASASLVSKGVRQVDNLVRRSVVERGWFRSVDKQTSAVPALLGCIGLFFVGPVVIFAGFVLTTELGLGLVSIAAAVAVGLALAALLMRRPGRTAAGQAVYHQVAGFQRYIEVAEAEQLRFEEGADIFSRYLPWAIVFGLTDRWARTCERLAVQGRIPPSVDWYSGSRPWSYSRFPTTMSTLTSTVSMSMAPSTGSWSTGGRGSSSSGSSGFSSSSSSGSGGGGGGGGSW